MNITCVQLRTHGVNNICPRPTHDVSITEGEEGGGQCSSVQRCMCAGKGVGVGGGIALDN